MEKSILVENPNASLEEKYEAFKKYRKTYPNVVGHKPYARNMEFIMQRKRAILNLNKINFIKNG